MQFLKISGKQIEAVIVNRRIVDLREVRAGPLIAAQVRCDQIAARTRGCLGGEAIAEIRYCRDSAAACNAEPCAAVLKVPARIYIRIVVPERGGRGWSCVHFIAVRREDERKVAMHFLSE